MKKIFYRLILIAIAITFFACADGKTNGITVFLLNTEFFFDHESPHGRVIGNNLPIPTKKQFETKAKDLAKLIDLYDASIVGLTEIENRNVLEELKSHLDQPKKWQIIFDEGRDTYTGQDVAILTKFRVKQNSITDFPDQYADYIDQGEKKSVRPSKILGAEIEINGQPIYLLICHFISRRSSNDAKRLGQAIVVRRQAVRALSENKNVIVMGDMNDTPGTPPIQTLRGLDDEWADLIQTAESVGISDRYTYIYKGKKSLLDHVLISPSLADEFTKVDPKRRCEIFDTQLSDHRGIIVRLNFGE